MCRADSRVGWRFNAAILLVRASCLALGGGLAKEVVVSRSLETVLKSVVIVCCVVLCCVVLEILIVFFIFVVCGLLMVLMD